MRCRVRRLAACVVMLAIATSAASCGGGERPSPLERHAGRNTYRVSCAGCHGADGQGNGPVAPLLTVKVPDLTRIAARRGGTFPQLEIYRIIDGQAELKGHGSRHMPVWGYEFFGDEADDEAAHREATEKVDQLVAYLRSIQRAD